MNTHHPLTVLLFSSLLACGQADELGDLPASQTAASSLDQALRNADLGSDLQDTCARLEAARLDDSLPRERRHDVELALASAYHARHEQERALSVLEETLAREGSNDWARRAEAESMLRLWLVGQKPEVAPPSDSSADLLSAPIASAFANTFPQPVHGRFELTLLRFGGDDTADKLGTFNVAEALRKQNEERCPLCEPQLSTSTTRSRHTDWLGLVQERARIADALTVFYYDRDADKIPARYDDLLPMPTAEIEARLTSGKGFYLVKQREGAPPLVLIAAPRRAQLPVVEGRLASSEELPQGPVDVDVPGGLTRNEIRAGVRAQFPAIRACYEALPEPRPAGVVELSFVIDGQGRVGGVQETKNTDLTERALIRCVRDAVSKARFAALGGETRTTYPIRFAP